MRISDWSSDVCSSDLERRQRPGHQRRGEEDRGVAGMNDAKLYSVIRAPRVSEKTARLQEISNQYAFEVAKTATKADIKRSEEHTSELQSLMRISYAVFCLKKKKKKQQKNDITYNKQNKLHILNINIHNTMN